VPAESISAGTVASYDSEQLANANIIVSVGVGRGFPARGLIIAVATAIQESTLHNYGDLGDRNDHDSLALFQQRPSQGWGTPRTAITTGMTAGCHGGDGMFAIGEHLPADFTLPADTPLPVAIAIWWALQQLGTPYHFGGSCTDPHSGDPNRQCDCSSLMQQAYRNAGIAIPRVTDDQQHFGTPVASATELKPGDLVFIPGSGGTMDDPGHVGMYIGQGIIVQSPHTGDFVKLTKLDSWMRQIAKIRRIVAW